MYVYLPILLNKMDILQLQHGEPFAVGIQVLAQFPVRELRKLENFTKADRPHAQGNHRRPLHSGDKDAAPDHQR